MSGDAAADLHVVADQKQEAPRHEGRAHSHGAGESPAQGGMSPEAAAALAAMPDEELIYDLADLYKVFSDATRVKIMYALAGGELCVACICEVTSSTQSAVSHQLRILKQAHLVRARREGRNVVYALADAHVLTLLETGMEHICE